MLATIFWKPPQQMTDRELREYRRNLENSIAPNGMVNRVGSFALATMFSGPVMQSASIFYGGTIAAMNCGLAALVVEDEIASVRREQERRCPCVLL